MGNVDRFLEKYLGGHVNIGRFTIYGFNAMHVAFQYRCKCLRSYICFHPHVYLYGRWWPWHFYISRNATPWAATYCIGPGVYAENRIKAKRRLRLLRHIKREERRHVGLRIHGLPAGYQDAVFCNTEFTLGIWDRVKLLFGWRLYYQEATLCESCPGITRNWKAKVTFLRPGWLERRRKPCCAVANDTEIAETADDGNV